MRVTRTSQGSFGATPARADSAANILADGETLSAVIEISKTGAPPRGVLKLRRDEAPTPKPTITITLEQRVTQDAEEEMRNRWQENADIGEDGDPEGLADSDHADNSTSASAHLPLAQRVTADAEEEGRNRWRQEGRSADD